MSSKTTATVKTIRISKKHLLLSSGKQQVFSYPKKPATMKIAGFRISIFPETD